MELEFVTETFSNSKDSVLRPFRYLKGEVLRRQGSGFGEVRIESQGGLIENFPQGLKAAKVKINKVRDARSQPQRKLSQ